MWHGTKNVFKIKRFAICKAVSWGRALFLNAYNQRLSYFKSRLDRKKSRKCWSLVTVNTLPSPFLISEKYPIWMERKLFSFLDDFYSQKVPSFSSRLRDQDAAIYLVLYVPSSLTTLILKPLSCVLFAVFFPPNLAQYMFEIVNSFHDSISKVAWKAGAYGKSKFLSSLSFPTRAFSVMLILRIKH